MYHQIASVPRSIDPLGLAVSPAVFKAQMAYMSNHGYRCINLSQIVQRVSSGLVCPDKCFAITFDDGYLDVYTSAAPIIQEYGFTATVFVVTECVGRAGETVAWEGGCPSRFLSWADVRELSRFGISVGSHTLSHPSLPQLDEPVALREIRDSKAVIEDKLGKEVSQFSYPYSRFDSRIQRIAIESGYEACCGADRGAWSRYNLWRAQCTADDSHCSFALKAGGWHHRITWLREESAMSTTLQTVARLIRRYRRPSTSGR